MFVDHLVAGLMGWGPRTSSAPCTPGMMAVALPRLNVVWICECRAWGGAGKRGMSAFETMEDLEV